VMEATKELVGERFWRPKVRQREDLI
jgi:hypothetical protein